MIFLGIDPGKSGGIAALKASGEVLKTAKMPVTESDLLGFFEWATHVDNGYDLVIEPARAVLELVRATPQMGVVSAFTFGKGYGAIRMALASAGIPFDEVTPPVWQRVMQCRTHGDKNISKRRAQELFPTLTITHALADALLLAEYARRMEQTRGSFQTQGQGHKRTTTEVRARRQAGAQTDAIEGRRRAGALRAAAAQPAHGAAAGDGGRTHRGAR